MKPRPIPGLIGEIGMHLEWWQLVYLGRVLKDVLIGMIIFKAIINQENQKLTLFYFDIESTSLIPCPGS